MFEGTGAHLTTSADAEVVVQLLDPTQGTTVKSWQFRGRSSISIGRGDDQDVEIADSYVSRTHAVLELRDDQWMLLSRGRNGVFLNNQPITEHAITGDITFRLGPQGPVLAFKARAQKDENLATLSFDTLPIPLFALDEARLQEEVGAIAERDDFQRLREQARELRRKKGQA